VALNCWGLYLRGLITAEEEPLTVLRSQILRGRKLDYLVEIKDGHKSREDSKRVKKLSRLWLSLLFGCGNGIT